ncbi:hypothetical protein BD779DRAFT_1456855 [Infundibulicybe gibba]|nr:hypothetical protein BD779DRAFT_1456855 [Infundibulicybe gibba]
MPLKGARTAPAFNTKVPRHIIAYFRDLESLFDRAGVVDNEEKKRYATYYLEYNVAEMWEALESYSKDSFAAFKKVVSALYPGGDGSIRYTYHDLESLAIATSRVGITHSDELVDYIRNFQEIADYLRNLGQASALDLARIFPKAFQPALALEVGRQLRMTHPLRLATDPYMMSDYQEAARIVLRQTQLGALDPIAPATPPPAPAPVAQTSMDIAAIVAQVMAIQQQTQQQSMPTYYVAKRGCTFCGVMGHFMKECRTVEQYMREGKVRRNHANRLIIGTGAEIPEAKGQAPLHPFRNVKEATYEPPQPRILGATAPKVPKVVAPAKRPVPVQNAQMVRNVVDAALNAPVTLTQEQLLTLAPDIRAHIFKLFPAQQPNSEATLALSTEDALPYAIGDDNDAPTGQAPPPPNSLVIEDTYDTFISAHGTFGHEAFLRVAKESHPLRSIRPIVDNQVEIEAIIDPGSQIIAMSEEVCHRLGLQIDPTVQLDMQSANGTVDKSLGLARNVSIRLGNITLYVQMHIIRKPAYDILLGRPFDVLTESVVQNHANENQTLTIRDPNTGATATIPTIPRGQRVNTTSEQDF